jgi:hypothetical protein
MGYIKNARFRTGVSAGVSGDTSGYGPFVNSGTANAGTPTSGTAGFAAGTAKIGALAIGGTKLFINTNTQASPTWTVVGSQS